MLKQISWNTIHSSLQMAQQTVGIIMHYAQRAIEQEGEFRIVLAGGHTPISSYQLLSEQIIDFSHWHFYFSDERCVPRDHEQRNSLMVDDHLFSRIDVPERNIHIIPAELGAEAGAAAYEPVVKAALPFHFSLLGVGEDGHTASLFPGQYHDPQALVVPVHDAPKPPPDRVSLNYTALNQSQCVLFLIDGYHKQQTIRRWREVIHDHNHHQKPQFDIPAQRVTGLEETIVLMTRNAWVNDHY